MQGVVDEKEGEVQDAEVEDVRIETGPLNGIIFTLSDLLQEREASDTDVITDNDEEKEELSQPEPKDACSLEHLSQGVSFPRLRRSCRLELYSCTWSCQVL